MLKPQDIVVILKVHNLRGLAWTYSELANKLYMSSSEIHAALKRCETSTLYDSASRKVRRNSLTEFLVYGFKYVFPVSPGALGRGIPTAHSAEPLRSLINADSNDIYVWIDPNGSAIGQSILPLYRSVPAAVKEDLELYELLSLIDALRVGRVREQNIAIQELKQRLAIQ